MSDEEPADEFIQTKLDTYEAKIAEIEQAMHWEDLDGYSSDEVPESPHEQSDTSPASHL